jgi:hypothetical protein
MGGHVLVQKLLEAHAPQEAIDDGQRPQPLDVQSVGPAPATLFGNTLLTFHASGVIYIARYMGSQAS